MGSQLSLLAADFAAERLPGRPVRRHPPTSNGIIFSPGERGKNAVATAVPEPGLYFVEFNAAVATAR